MECIGDIRTIGDIGDIGDIGPVGSVGPTGSFEPAEGVKDVGFTEDFVSVVSVMEY